MSILDLFKRANEVNYRGRNDAFRNYYTKSEAEILKTPKKGVPATDTSVSGEDIIVNPLTAVFNEFYDDTSVMNEMYFEPVIHAAIELRQSGLRSLEFGLDFPDDVPDGVRELFEAQLEKFNFYELIFELQKAVFFGFVPVTLIWGADNLIAGIRGEDWRKFQLNYDGIVVYSETNRVFNRNEIYPAVNGQSTANVYGQALLAALYGTWKYKTNIKKFWARYVEKTGTPFTAAKLKETGRLNDNEYQDLISNTGKGLAKIYQQSYGVFPENVEIETLQTAATVNSYKEFVEYLDKEISRVVVGSDSINIATPGRLGNNNESNQALQIILESDRRFVEACIKDIFGFVADANGIDRIFVPKFNLTDGTDIDKELKQAQRDALLFNMLDLDKKYFISQYAGLDDSTLIDVNKQQQTTTEQPREPEPKENRLKGAFSIVDKINNISAVNQSIVEVEQNEAALNKLVTMWEGGKTNALLTQMRNEVLSMIDNYESPKDLLSDIENIYGQAGKPELAERIKVFLTVTDIYGKDTFDSEV